MFVTINCFGSSSTIVHTHSYDEHKFVEMISVFCLTSSAFNTLRPRQNGRHFPDDIFKCIFLNENVWISISISLKFVPEGPINNIPALVQIMAWRRPGDKPLSEPMQVNLLTHICVTRPQCVKLQLGPVRRILLTCQQCFLQWLHDVIEFSAWINIHQDLLRNICVTTKIRILSHRYVHKWRWVLYDRHVSVLSLMT